jgi:Rieske Fe-S protein
MAGEDQERFEDYLELERFIEDLQAGHVAHAPEGLTPDQARIYRMATLFHAASIEEAAPRPEFVAELQAKLEQIDTTKRAPTKKSRPFFSKQPPNPQTNPRVSRRALLTSGAVAAVAAASLSVGVGIDHVTEENRIRKLTATPTWQEDLVPTDVAAGWIFVTTLAEMGDQAVRFTSDAIVGYVIRGDGDSGDPADNGKVVAMSAACTHMGCIVQWQNSDRKYHCPCHGGIFTEYGKTNNTISPVRYSGPLPRLETRVDAAGNVFVRVPTVPIAATL